MKQTAFWKRRKNGDYIIISNLSNDRAKASFKTVLHSIHSILSCP